MTKPFVRPDVAALLAMIDAAGRPPMQTLDAPAARVGSNAARKLMEVELGEMAVIRDFAIPGPAGPIGARLFDAAAERAAGDLIVFFHGGGFVIGDLDSHGPLCADLSRLMSLPVVSVDYRLAPEHPFPAGPDDAIAAARWLAAHSGETGREAKRLVVIGDSAGANLALLAAIDLRDEPAAVPVAAQGLIYPVTGPVVAEGSGRDFAEGYVLTRPLMDWFDSHYAPALGDWRHETHLRGYADLPPTAIITASLDPLRDQGRALAAALAVEGIEISYLEAQGNIHGFATMRRLVPSAHRDIERLCEALKMLLASRS
ncbi:MAG: alpha/beta hydrolase [Sphingomonas bacterium]|nr:alpha/beta hydrolase [Sphingomonas bacterium]